MNEEILAGLKNALDRGSSLEEAVQSFINAGYNANDVRETAASFSRGVSQIIRPALAAPAQTALYPQISSQEAVEMLKAPAGAVAKPKKSGKKIFIIGLIVLLILVAGTIVLLTLFRDQVMQSIQNFLP